MQTPLINHRLSSTGIPRSFAVPPRGLTLTELLVAVVLTTGIIAMVAGVFATASKAAGRTNSHADLLQTAHGMEQAFHDDLRSIMPGFLLIFSPNVDPTLGRYPGPELPDTIADIPDVAPLRPSDQGVGIGSVPRRLTRADMISFVSTGREHTSAWHYSFEGPSGQEHAAPLVRPSALITYGHGVDPINPTSITLPSTEASSWQLMRRCILFDVRGAGHYSVDGGVAIDPPDYSYTLTDGNWLAYRYCTNDATRTTAENFISEVQNQSSSTVQPETTYARNFIYPDLFGDPAQMNDPNSHFRRHCFRFMPNVGSITIEWTDGSAVDPTNVPDSNGVYLPRNPATQWFGRPRDAQGDALSIASRNGSQLGVGELTDSDDVMTRDQYVKRYSTVLPIEAVNTTVDGMDTANGDYFAKFLQTTWANRPTAIRFIVRLYDRSQRINNIEVWPPDRANAALEKRYGLEFTITVPIS